jgi:MoxR-like ATPase
MEQKPVHSSIQLKPVDQEESSRDPRHAALLVKETTDQILDTIQRYFVGDRTLSMKVLAAALANDHILFEDNPGLGKNLLAKIFAKATGCDWGRVQFTPDARATWRSKAS